MSNPKVNTQHYGSDRGYMPADTDQSLQAFSGYVQKKVQAKCKNAYERNHYTHALWVRFCGQWLAREVV